jgi:hypothetical protein
MVLVSLRVRHPALHAQHLVNQEGDKAMMRPLSRSVQNGTDGGTADQLPRSSQRNS